MIRFLLKENLDSNTKEGKGWEMLSSLVEERVIPQVIPKGEEIFQNWQHKLGLLSDSCNITNCSGETLQENNEEVKAGATWTRERGLKRLINL